MNVPLFDLKSQYSPLREEIRQQVEVLLAVDVEEMPPLFLFTTGDAERCPAGAASIEARGKDDADADAHREDRRRSDRVLQESVRRAGRPADDVSGWPARDARAIKDRQFDDYARQRVPAALPFSQEPRRDERDDAHLCLKRRCCV